MSKYETIVGNAKTGHGGSLQYHLRERRPHRGQLSDIAKKTVQARTYGLAVKAARKTSAQPVSDSASSEDEHDHDIHDPQAGQSSKNRRTPPTSCPGGKDTDHSDMNETDSISQRSQIQLHSATKTRSSALPQRLIVRNSPAPSRSRPSLVSDQVLTPLEYFSDDMTKVPISTPPDQQHSRSIGGNPYAPDTAHLKSPVSSISRSFIHHTPAARNIASSGRILARKCTQHSSPPSKPRAGVVEDPTPTKLFSPRKTFLVYSGNRSASRMIATSVSSRRNGTSVSMHAEDVAQTIYLRRGTVNNYNGQDSIDHDLDADEDSTSSRKVRRMERTEVASKILPARRARLKAAERNQIAQFGDTETSNESLGDSSDSYVDEGVNVSAYSSSRNRTKRELRRKSWKKRNWRKPPPPRKKSVANVPVDAEDGLGIAGHSGGNGDSEPLEQVTVQPAVLSALDLVTLTDQNNDSPPPLSPHSCSSTSFHQKAQHQLLPLPAEDTLETSTQHTNCLASDESSQGYSSSHLIHFHPDGLDDRSGEVVAGPSNNLTAALKVFILPSLRMQKTGHLPFLLRNLRRGFSNRCLLLGVPIIPHISSDASLEVQLAFRLWTSRGTSEDAEDCSDEYTTRMTSWSCPLCDLHGHFGTQAMLQKHIEWDHSEIKTKWIHDSIRTSKWTIILYVPKPRINLELEVVAIDNKIEYGSTKRVSPPLVPIGSPVAAPESSIMLPDILLPVQRSPFSSELATQHPPPRSVTWHVPQTSPRSQSHSATVTSFRAEVPELSSQLPTGDRLGLSAQHSESSEDGQMYFSCRPGGPRVYDLLNTLPLAPFGLLAWFVVDREEEMFELNDILDEDKVIQALWGRWILLKRQEFLADYYQGIMTFIDENWHMIHRAAGWAALRTLLLMFVVNKFLTGSEVAQLLRHYEGLTKMNFEHTGENL